MHITGPGRPRAVFVIAKPEDAKVVVFPRAVPAKANFGGNICTEKADLQFDKGRVVEVS